jgi:hypothetical protein
MSTKYFTATCKQLAENEFLVESSEGGKLQFRIEMKDGEKTGVLGDFEPKGRADAADLISKSFSVMFKENVTKFEFLAKDKHYGELFIDRILEIRLLEKTTPFEKKETKKKSFWGKQKIDILFAKLIFETNLRPHGTPSLRAIEIVKEMAKNGADWCDLMTDKVGKFFLHEKSWRQIVSALGALSPEELGSSGAKFLIGTALSEHSSNPLSKIASYSIHKILGEPKELILE